MRKTVFKRILFRLICLVTIVVLWLRFTAPPTLYEYYGMDKRREGLVAHKKHFTLNGRELSLFSGSIHYFRVPPPLWRDRLRRMRAAGVFAVETYVPWNLHNPAPGVYDFGDGESSWSPFLNISRFLTIAQEEDLLVLIRPGPYICAEWDFGGLPSWLLRDPHMKVRSSYQPFKDAVKKYFHHLIPRLASMHWLRGGPIIAVQVENEYDSMKVSDTHYLEFLKFTMADLGLPGLFFTSNSVIDDLGSLPGVLRTINFGSRAAENLKMLSKLQPDKVSMVMEFWCGWFDHWMNVYHRTVPLQSFEFVLRGILNRTTNFNFYMFHGGTNFGFMNGANVNTSSLSYQPDVNSYDYDAPLTEAGDYTPKWFAVRDLLKKYSKVVLRTPLAPAERPKGQPDPAPIVSYLSLSELIKAVPPRRRYFALTPLPMELLELDNGIGQSYGFLLYRLRRKNVMLRRGSKLVVRGYVRDVALVLINGTRVTPPLLSLEDVRGFGYWEKKNASFVLSNVDVKVKELDVLVENWGRVNFGFPNDFNQYKGIIGSLELDGDALHPWEHVALEFQPPWLNSLENWEPSKSLNLEWKSWRNGSILLPSPSLFKIEVFFVNLADTWIDMRGWCKGVVFVNGFALGRYLHLGPPRTLFWPTPLQQKGINEILVFELFSAPQDLKLHFSSQPILGRLEKHSAFQTTDSFYF